uniref:penicillin-binding protein activator n=1 Tax=Aquabacterium sp. TaxID=1872578 RepID=UPI0025BD53B5
QMDQLKTDKQIYANTLSAELALGRSQPKAALTALNHPSLQHLGEMPVDLQTRTHTVRARALEADGQTLAAASERVFMGPLLQGDALSANNDAIWTLVAALPPEQLQSNANDDMGGWLSLALALSLAVWALAPLFIKQGDLGLVQFTAHRFRFMPTPAQAGSAWQDVNLPDTWAARGIPSKGVARYESSFVLRQPLAGGLAQQTWAVRVDRLSFQHRIWVNGQLIHISVPEGEPTGRPLAYMVQFPVSLLQDGVNRLTIEARYGSMGGLSAPMIGPMTALDEGFTAQSFLTQDLPLAINIVAAAFALFLILIWWRRRSELGMGMLGMLCVVVSVRNCSYYIVHGPTLHPDLSAWLYFTAQTTATVLLGAFAMAIAEQGWPWFRRVLWSVLLGFPLVAGVAAQQGLLAEARSLLYPVLLLLMLPTLALLLKLHRRFNRVSAMGMILGIAVSLVAGVHDYLRMQGLVSVMHTYWLPLATPITLASYGIVLMHRFVELTRSTEALNVALEARVGERTEALLAANAAKGHFLAAASHDLRQPVAAVGLLSSLLRDRLRDSPLQGMTVKLMEAVRAMEGLLNGLLDLSRLDAGAIKPHWQAVDLHTMLRGILSHEQEAASLRGLSLRVHPTRAVAWSDPVLLEQMVRNLVGNALRYTQRGGVLVGVRHRGEHLLIQVWDSGQGIAEADQQRIFEDFVQLGNPERNQAKGLGLGLAIVQRAARLMACELTLRSRPGMGSCFSIKVPMAQGRQHHDGYMSEHIATMPPKVARPLADRHIVLLDDDEILRHALREQLRAWGAHVSEVGSLEDLEELLQRIMSVDVLLTDHRLQDGNGLQAIHMARTLHPRLPAVVITGDTGSVPLQQLQASGVPVLHKPFRAEVLLLAIRHQLSEG